MGLRPKHRKNVAGGSDSAFVSKPAQNKEISYYTQSKGGWGEKIFAGAGKRNMRIGVHEMGLRPTPMGLRPKHRSGGFSWGRGGGRKFSPEQEKEKEIGE